MHALKIQRRTADQAGGPEQLAIETRLAEIKETLLIDIEEFARLAGVSSRSLRRLDHQGLVGPSVVELGRARRWRRAEVVSWINAGCPVRDSWEWTATDE
jgi:predicted DNA-binding transcriptional regulator AlpA